MLAWHTTLTCYGFWLPNDPRGSKSHSVRVPAIARHGPPSWVETTASVAKQPHDRSRRQRAKQALAREPVRLDGEQARAVALGIAGYCRRRRLAIWSFCILPDPVHLLTTPPPLAPKVFVAQLKAAGTRGLAELGRHPDCSEHQSSEGKRPRTPWSRGYWVRYVDDRRHLAAVRRYITKNPTQAGYPEQTWSFVERPFTDHPR